MQLSLPGAPHLTYCTNIHAGESWADVRSSLGEFLPAVKSAMTPDKPLAVGLRLSAQAARTLADPAALAEFKEFMSCGGYYVISINAFPYGTFHGVPVKDGVYAPDWRSPERLRYTNQVGDLLAAMAPIGIETSISTVPGAFRAAIGSTADIERMVENLVRCAAHLYELNQTKGRSIILAVEPEPACFLETTQELVDFFGTHVFSEAARKLFAGITGVAPRRAAELLREHIGICYDVCHSAVAFEDPEVSLAALEAADIRVAKIQLSAALKLKPVTASTAQHLRKFDDGIYLHQTVQSDHGRKVSFTDLPDALAALETGAVEGEWRVHCHVPLFTDSFADLQSTQDELRVVLGLCRRKPITLQLEVETYTWNILPPELRRGGLADSIIRELAWVQRELSA